MLLKCGNINDDIAVMPYSTTLGLINCSNIAIKKVPLLVLTSWLLAGTSVFTIRYAMYSAPRIFIKNWILGTTLYKNEETNRHSIISIKPPVKTPRLKLMPFLKPTFFALFIDMILFGPGVNARIRTYDKNENHGNIVAYYLLNRKFSLF